MSYNTRVKSYGKYYILEAPSHDPEYVHYYIYRETDNDLLFTFSVHVDDAFTGYQMNIIVMLISRIVTDELHKRNKELLNETWTSIGDTLKEMLK